jgi:hypothetical protein
MAQMYSFAPLLFFFALAERKKEQQQDFRLSMMFYILCVIFRPAGRKMTHNKHKVPCCRRLKLPFA